MKRDTERDDTIRRTPRYGRAGSVKSDTTESWNYLRKRCEDLKILRCFIRPRLRHEKYRSFLFSRLDLLNRTDPGEEVGNVEYLL